ncbi:MAG: energy transducer TonB, partial [Saprospiraceae bacterium]
MKKPIHPKKFLPTLTYEGGDKKLFQFITNHLKYPLEAIENKIEGTVIVKYEINYKGHITQTKVISGIG